MVWKFQRTIVRTEWVNPQLTCQFAVGLFCDPNVFQIKFIPLISSIVTCHNSAAVEIVATSEWLNLIQMFDQQTVQLMGAKCDDFVKVFTRW